MFPDEKKFVILLILDGWGIAPPGPGNAISLAETPNINQLMASFPHTQLLASGDAVGLPRSEVGNTETGHLNLGAGRIVYQDLERINMAVADGSFFKNPVLKQALEHAQKFNSKIHLLGLLGAGGVHSSAEHLYALIKYFGEQKFDRLFLHIITDGRDSPPTASASYINSLRRVIQQDGVGTIASLMGRYWAMDRDRRWDRTQRAYEALTEGKGNLVKTPEEAIQNSYSEGKTDEFIEPALITNQEGKPISLVSDDDVVIFFNFRIDRPRQLTSAFVVDDFSNTSLSLDFDPYLEKYKKTHLSGKALDYQKVFERKIKLKNLFFCTMTEYSKSLTESGAHPLFPPEIVEMPLGRVISENSLRQLRMSESEKERFVTFYFNGQRENPFPGEERIIVPSPNVPTYDLKPEMSVYELTDRLINTLKQDTYQFVLVNFANPDMVAHTGNIGAAVKACAAVDECVGKIANFVLAYGGYLLITADHGNVEVMINPSTGQIETEHNNSPVPFIAISRSFIGKPQTLISGILADVAPTVVSLLGLSIPSQMTGRNLLSEIKI
jgi:2,3-bisphosphoglycerate-independent phosphoglycerate mutase